MTIPSAPEHDAVVELLLSDEEVEALAARSDPSESEQLLWSIGIAEDRFMAADSRLREELLGSIQLQEARRLIGSLTLLVLVAVAVVLLVPAAVAAAALAAVAMKAGMDFAGFRRRRRLVEAARCLGGGDAPETRS
ncbi:MAG TPA: hypothetical protein ENK43_16855 [Planctomycetes bacterium]|nr:hypothetical protein [Planctomycetota bacterium]